jgi:rhodanese-related sulfurtransferase
MESLTVEELKKMQQQDGDLTVINVLDEKQYRQAHIPDSENVPRSADDFVERVERLVGSKDDPVVVYCASTECTASPKAARTLEEAGFNRVYDFEGGVKAWNDAGERVVMST